MTEKELLTRNPENEKLLEFIPIEDTPFTAARNDKDWYLMIGKYRLTEKMESLEAVIENSKNTSWDRLIAIFEVVIAANEKIEILGNRIQRLEDIVSGAKSMHMPETEEIG